MESQKKGQQQSPAIRGGNIANSQRSNYQIAGGHNFNLHKVKNVTINVDSSNEAETKNLGPNALSNTLINFAKYVFEKIGPEKYYTLFSLTSIGTGITAAYAAMPSFGNFSAASASNAIYQNTGIAILSGLFLVISISMLILPEGTKCKDCGKIFAMKEINRKQIGKQYKRGNTLMKDIRIFRKCENCGHEDHKDTTIELTNFSNAI